MTENEARLDELVRQQAERDREYDLHVRAKAVELAVSVAPLAGLAEHQSLLGVDAMIERYLGVAATIERYLKTGDPS